MYTFNKSISNIINSFSHVFIVLPKCFYSNFRVLSPVKCLFMLYGVDDELQTDLLRRNETLKNSIQEKVWVLLFTTNSTLQHI